VVDDALSGDTRPAKIVPNFVFGFAGLGDSQTTVRRIEKSGNISTPGNAPNANLTIIWQALV
jgi:hypothetical protein